MRRYPRYMMVGALFLAATPVVAYITYFTEDWYVYPTITALFGLVVLGTGTLASKVKNAGIVWGFGGVLMGVLVIAGFGFAFLSSFFSIFEAVELNPKRYSEIVKAGKEHSYHVVDYFPDAIPPDARRVRFYATAGMAAGNCLQLRYKAPNAHVRRVLSQFLSKAKQVQDGSKDEFQAVHERNGLPTTDFRDSRNRGFAPLPKDFKVLVLDAKSKRYSKGVAVSLKRNEVIYWVEID